MKARLHTYVILGALVACATVLLPTLAYAQAQIVGQVRDESGGVLPGVTVEAASPAIIEKVRSAVTDDQGRYRIDALRPGTYKLTFSLTGFSTVAREAIEVPSEVVVTINADMKVGALEETITVSGETPQIDVQQASSTQVITRDIIDTLPVSRNVMSIGVLSAGVRPGTPDIGGSRMTEQVGLRAHGLAGEDAEQLVEGMSIQSLEGASQSYFDDMLQSEITIMTSAIPADTSGGGIRMNSVLKDGGNIFSGAAFLGFSSGDVAERQRGRRAARRAEQHQQPERHQAHSHVHRIAGRSDQARQDVVHRRPRGISRRTKQSPTCRCRSRRREARSSTRISTPTCAVRRCA